MLEKEAKIFTRDKDIFVNVADELSIKEPAGDLAVALATVSSIKNKALEGTVVFCDIGLSSEVRGVHFADIRLKESLSYSFKRAIVPKNSVTEIEGMKIIGVRHIREVATVENSNVR